MAEDLATLSLGLENARTIAAARDVGAAFDAMGTSGMNAARNIVASGSPVEQAIVRQAQQFRQLRQDILSVEQARVLDYRAARNQAGATDELAASWKRMKDAANQRQANGMASMIQASDPFQQQAKSLNDAAEAAGKHRLALGRINNTLEALAFDLVGANAKLGSLSTKFLEFGIGGVVTAAVLAGIAILGFAWDKYTAKAREAAKANDDAMGRLKDLAKQQRQGAFGNTPDDLGQAWKNALAATADLRRLEALTVGGLTGTSAETKAKNVAAARERQRIALDAITAGNREINKVQSELDQKSTEDAAQKHAKDLAEWEKYYKSLIELDKEMAARRSLGDHADAMMGTDSASIAKSIAKQTKAFAAQNAAAKQGLDASFQQELDEFVQQARDIAQKHKELLDSMRSATSDFFRDVLEHGTSAFGRLFSNVKGMFAQMIADIAAKDLVGSALGKSMAGFIGTAATATTPATGAGGSVLSGLGAAAMAHPMIAAGVAIGALTLGFLGLRKSAEESRAEHERLNDAYKANIASIRTLLGQASPLDKELSDLKVQFDDLRKQAGALVIASNPKSLVDYADRLRELNDLESRRAVQLQQQAEDEKKFYAQDLEARLLAAQGHQQEADDLQFLTQQQRDYAAAVTAGKSAIELANLAEVQRAETIARTIAKLQTQISSYSATIDGLKSFKDALLLSDAAGLSPTAKLAEAQRQYDEVIKAANAGDQGAAGRIPAVAQTLIDIARENFGSAPAFQAILDQVQRDTDTTITYYVDARTLAQQQLDELKKILDAIILQTTTIETTSRPTNGDRNDDHHRGDGSGGGSGSAANAAIMASGFQQLIESVDGLSADVRENTRVTRNGLEGLAS